MLDGKLGWKKRLWVSGVRLTLAKEAQGNAASFSRDGESEQRRRYLLVTFNVRNLNLFVLMV